MCSVTKLLLLVDDKLVPSNAEIKLSVQSIIPPPFLFQGNSDSSSGIANLLISCQHLFVTGLMGMSLLTSTELNPFFLKYHLLLFSISSDD